ncbi:cytochrome c nitrite reductase small subunit [Mangrovivirga cuniculi]|uniref:Cytochrome c nitrite reductase small subunit n=1 Tax=Mangrovivirga cuniculi TaxID=2715131 RepID=A0A4D7KA51_9BACT|nr:cytochrome c nitrite reductase small subunit [Mangrovivirga cuniculi]QCK16228.1 cytochrome c nitrite reductase small subunit [Mangrovivirga cuniculi]
MSLFKNIFPKKKSRWRTIATVSIASLLGLGAFIAYEAHVTSYLSDDPQACVNCHVMTPVYNSWMHSSHREWATCNDCHVPHDNVFNQYYFKAKDGLYHASIFTLRAEPDVIFMREESEKVVQNNCIRCHVQQITQAKYEDWIESHKSDRLDRTCWSCHRTVPHGRLHGLTTVKYNIAPVPTNQTEVVIPEWLEKEIDESKTAAK